MSDAIPLWVHCNNCTSRDMSSLLMTSCGKVICCRCRPSLATSTCPECRGPCSRVIRLLDAPREVRVLFKDVSQQLKIVMKMMSFEDLQRRNLLNHRRDKVCHYILCIMLFIKDTLKCFQLQRLKQRSIEDQQDLLELVAAKEKMAQKVRRLERNIARKKEEREKVSNRDNEKGKNGIRRSGIIITIILLRSSNFYPYCTQERKSYSVQTSSLSWVWKFLHDERIPSHPSFPACSGESKPHHPRQEEAAAGDGEGDVPHDEDSRGLAQVPAAVQQP